MKPLLILASLLGVVTVAALATRPSHAQGTPAEKSLVKVDGGVKEVVVRDGLLYALSPKGTLVSLTDPQGQPKTLVNFNVTPGPFFDVKDGKATIAAGNRVLVADLAQGKIVADRTFDKAVGALCFVSADKLAVLNPGELQIVDAGTARTLATIPLGESKATLSAEMRGSLCVQGEQLYLAVPGLKDGLLVVDLKDNKVTGEIPIPSLKLGSGIHVGTMSREGDRLYIVTLRFAYGVWTDSLGYLNLKTREFTKLDAPSKLTQESVIAGQPNGTFYLLANVGVHAFGADGKLLGAVLGESKNRPAQVWRDRVVLVSSEGLEFVPATVRPELKTTRN